MSQTMASPEGATSSSLPEASSVPEAKNDGIVDDAVTLPEAKKDSIVDDCAKRDDEENPKKRARDALATDSDGSSDNTAPAKKVRLPKTEKKRAKREARRVVQQERRRESGKRRRKQLQTERRSVLDAMTEEERVVFLQKEKRTTEEARRELAAHMDKSFTEGKPKIVINCGFGDSMNEKELTSLAKQIQLTYGILKLSSIPFQLNLTSMDSSNAILPRLEKFGFSAWKAHIHEQPYWEVFSSVIVLTPDAEEEIDEVDADATYILGGLVDRTVSKNETLSQAAGKEAVVRCLRLPIRRYGPQGCASVLNIDRVVQLLLHRLEGASWVDALEECLPQRHLTPGARATRAVKCKDDASESDVAD
eukprot:GEMP01040210.1.p1 GENE.GEMP01040210.1~~GEMP01040210.1.p1  ORF type:complete len:363 (+),score=98.94 GEMP01040210.1:97-1185(+)